MGTAQIHFIVIDSTHNKISTSTSLETCGRRSRGDPQGTVRRRLVVRVAVMQRTEVTLSDNVAATLHPAVMSLLHYGTTRW